MESFRHNQRHLSIKWRQQTLWVSGGLRSTSIFWRRQSMWTITGTTRTSLSKASRKERRKTSALIHPNPLLAALKVQKSKRRLPRKETWRSIMGSSLGILTVSSKTHMSKTYRRGSTLQRIAKHINLGSLLNNLRNHLIKAKKKFYNNNAMIIIHRHKQVPFNQMRNKSSKQIKMRCTVAERLKGRMSLRIPSPSKLKYW